MKRKKLYLEKNNSNTFQILSHGDKIMEIKVSKVYKVGGVEYSSKEEAMKASAMEVLNTEIPLGVSNVLAKAEEIISALKIVGKK